MACTQLSPCIGLPLKREILEDIIDKAKDWALMHGASMRSKVNFSTASVQFVPFGLLPSAFPRKEFNKAIGIQAILNELFHKVAHDHEFLCSALKNIVEADKFTGNLFKIYETVHKEGITQVPVNTALEGLCEGMLEAWKLYSDPKGVILFVVEDVTYNICDQRFHEFEIRHQNPSVFVIRRTLTQIANTAKLSEKQELIIDDLPVAVVYFRSGYVPSQYPSNSEWDARLMIERSLAIKCPSIQYHLAGTKKVQQVLATRNILERFLTDPAKVEAVQDVFTGLYSLDMDEDGSRAAAMAVMKPECFVLKPQREGGGNNVYGKNVREVLQSMTDPKEQTAWILMERIIPPVEKGYVIKPDGLEVPQMVDLVSELGIFGVVIGNSSNVLVNRQVGYILRTKQSNVDEGGVAAGAGALNSPYLID